jgi:hypothetical protein
MDPACLQGRDTREAINSGKYLWWGSLREQHGSVSAARAAVEVA